MFYVLQKHVQMSHHHAKTQFVILLTDQVCIVPANRGIQVNTAIRCFQVGHDVGLTLPVIPGLWFYRRSTTDLPWICIDHIIDLWISHDRARLDLL